jgi:hypothetical protein
MLTLPDTQAVLETLEAFMGDRPALREGEGPDLAAPARGTYITYLKGPDGNVEGAVVTDLAASLYLGGMLLVVPESELALMARQGEASEAVLDGLSEIVNDLRGLLNQIAMNPHVTPTEPVPYSVPGPGDDAGWVLTPSRRVDFGGDTAFGRGYLTLLGR